MPPLRIVVEPERLAPRKLQRVVEILDRGGVALYPTDTVYGLGCAVDAKGAMERLNSLRKHERRHPLAVLCPDLASAARYAIISDFAHRIMRRVLPGPYTFVLPATREVPKLLLDKQRTVGIRISAHPVLQGLLGQLGRPLLNTSAMIAGEGRPVLDAEEGMEVWPDVDVAVDGGVTPGEPSTVISLAGGDIEVLRQGVGPVEGVLY